MKLELNNREKTELVKQHKIESKKRLVKTIRPHKGHDLFKVDLDSLEIDKATFDIKPCINWYDAVNGIYSKYKKLTVEANCIYISALNIENVKKVLKRDYQIGL